MAVFMLVPLVLLFVSLAGLILLWLRVVWVPGGGLPQCGQCGYAVRGATSLTCSECGSDFREVGISTPQSRGGVKPVFFAIFWTLCLPIPLLMLAVVLSAFGPHQHAYDESISIAAGQMPELGGDMDITVSQTTWGGAWWPTPLAGNVPTSRSASRGHPQSIAITFQRIPRQATIERIVFDLQNTRNGHSVSFDLAAGDTVADVQRTIQPLALPAGPQTTDAAAGLVDLAAQARSGAATISSPAWRFAGNRGSSASASLAPWFTVLIALLCVGIYAGGYVLYFYVRRRRRRHAQRQIAGV